MLTQDEHREACRVYMQKYRSKPENREKIRQQNAEYRKRKKQESIRQVSEIGTLEHTLDSQNSKISQLERQIVECNFKINLFEKEKLIPKNYLNIINELREQLQQAAIDFEDQNNLIISYQQQNQSLQQQLNQTQQQLQQIQLQQQVQLDSFQNGMVVVQQNNLSTPPSPASSSSSSLPHTPTSSSTPSQPPSFNSSFSSMNGVISNVMNEIESEQPHNSNNYLFNTTTTTTNNLIGNVNKKQKKTNNSIAVLQQESFSNHSTPPSSPSLQYLPNSPVLPNSIINLSPPPTPHPAQTSNSAISTPQPSFINTSNGNLSSLVPSEENGTIISSGNNGSSLSQFKSSSHFTLDLLCDVLQHEKSLQLPSVVSNNSTATFSENRKSGDFKTSIDFVLNNNSKQL